jgi:hypothetical protein
MGGPLFAAAPPTVGIGAQSLGESDGAERVGAFGWLGTVVLLSGTGAGTKVSVSGGGPAATSPAINNTT